MMIDLTGKSVFVKTQEEYLSVLEIAKLQGFTWGAEKNLNPIKIVFPNLRKLYKGCIGEPKYAKYKTKRG